MLQRLVHALSAGGARGLRLGCGVLGAVLLALPVFAQGGPPAPAAAPATGEASAKGPSAANKEQALGHFKRGIDLLGDQAWAPALAEFLLSRQLYPTRVATQNAVVALRMLQRYDEALDMLETLLRDFEVPAEQRLKAQREMAELRALVGTIDIAGSEPGAAISVSSQSRGEYPPIKPIRVAAGNHVVRLFKEGYEPFETRIDVAGGQTVTVKAALQKLTRSGKLRVTERAGSKVDVLVDGVVVGQTPWQGTISVGYHVVALRGEGKLGSPPAAAPVASEQLTALALVAEPLEASLRVEPTPPVASVWVDSVNVGRGVWIGRLKAGSHQIEARADGFLAAKQTMLVTKGERASFTPTLERDEEADIWKVPPKWTADVGAALVVVPTFGGDVAGACTGDCSRSLGLGLLTLGHASYELGTGLGFGLELGYLLAAQQVSGRQAGLVPHGLPAAQGTADDALRLSGFVAGATAGYHLGDRFPLVVRIGAGVVAAQLRDERSGRFTASDGTGFDAYPVVDFASAPSFYLDPGVRAGIRFAEHFELTGAVQLLLLIPLDRPRWNESLELAAGADGIGAYPADAMVGSFVLLVAPGANLRYDF